MTRLTITDTRVRFYIALIQEGLEYNLQTIYETDLYEKAKAAGAANNRNQLQTIIRELIDLTTLAHTFDLSRKTGTPLQFIFRPKQEILEQLQHTLTK